MAGTGPQSRSLDSLQSSEERSLLDAIDQLRSQGINHHVSLPQLIVCGDQSSGKSSVLEAISGVPFPAKDNLCTRFATELILRRTHAVDISVAIVPSATLPESERQPLLGFRETLRNFDDFPSLLDKAKEAMGISETSSAFSNDVLRVQISGPDRPHLSIVDLPGLIHSENKAQSRADVELVSAMVQGYMANPRSIILAVVSAKNDYANQIVLKLSKEADSKGLRTLGVITKPDTLPEGSDSELGFANLARNKDVEFRLGWHVLKNRDYRSRDCSTEERDRAEEAFFASGIWKELPREMVAIRSLRPRLSKVLLDHIRAVLPSLVAEIDSNIQSCQKQLEKLGGSRATLDEQRMFLLRISQLFQPLARAGIDGTYGDSFFGDPLSIEGYNKRLRSVIQNLNLDFQESMHTKGHRWHIVDRVDQLATANRHASNHLDVHPEKITRDDFVDKVRYLLQRSRGRELPGMFNPLIVGDLFNDQSRPWEGLARRHILASWKTARAFLDLVISHLTDENTAESLLREVVDPLMDKISAQLKEKVTEVLMPFQKGHPITYNHYFTETIQALREKRLEEQMTTRLRKFWGTVDSSTSPGTSDARGVQMKDLISALSTRDELDMDRHACVELLDCMEAYYKVSLKTVVDNIAAQAVEAVLVTGLDDLLSPALVMEMKADVVSRIAAESQETQDRRIQLSRTLTELEAGAATCKRFVGRSPSSKREERVT
ncbi:MAG: hypothetical protein M1838_001526 [Thelocarpon superellum]|nr:MAG: hypothetical protein M1838_001526 [Thelocarpon superellum]